MNDTKVLLCLMGILAVMFLGVLAVDNMPQVVVRNTPVYQSPQRGELVIPPSMCPPPSQPDCKPRFPEPTLNLPCNGVTNPGCTTYRKNEHGDFVKTGSLKDQYFHCVIHKEYVHKSKRYYLVWMEEKGFFSEFFILSEEGLNITGTATWK